MRRARTATVAALTGALVLAVGAGAAAGVLTLDDLREQVDGPGGTTHLPARHTVEAALPEREVAPTPVLEERPSVAERGDRGRPVRAVQARLAQIDWYSPPMSGRFDRETFRAVRGFQRKRGLDPSGEVDRRTWRRLVAMTERASEDVLFNRSGPRLHGPGDSGDEVREIQARLRQIAWYFGDVTDHYGDATATAVRGFQAKRGIPVTGEVDRRTLDLLHGMTAEPTADELANRPPDPADGAALDPRCLTGRTLCIDKSSNSLRWVVDGDVTVTLDVRFGMEGMETREGLFPVTYKSRDHVSSLYDTAMPFAMFFSGGQAVHYSPDFAANGYSGGSHGCVNVRDHGSIAWLFDQVSVGDRVVVYWS